MTVSWRHRGIALHHETESGIDRSAIDRRLSERCNNAFSHLYRLPAHITCTSYGRPEDQQLWPSTQNWLLQQRAATAAAAAADPAVLSIAARGRRTQSANGLLSLAGRRCQFSH